MLLSGQQTGCPWAVQPSQGMLLPLLHLQRDSLGRTWCCGVSGWTELLGWAKGGYIPAHISGDIVGHVTPVSSESRCLSLAVLGRRWAGGWEMLIGHLLAWASSGAGAKRKHWAGSGDSPWTPSLPSAALGELSVTEPVLSQHSAITHSRKPRQLRSMLRWAPCQGIDCP